MKNLTFSLWSVPVSIKPGFWIMTLLLSASSAVDETLLIWVAVVLVSILLHEFGHAIAFRAFGHQPRIELYEIGGLTYGSADLELTPLQEIIVSLAGPMAGFLLGGLVYGIAILVPDASTGLLGVVVLMLLWANIGWGLFNLVPIQPLDGAQALASTLDYFGMEGRLWTLRLTLPLTAAISLWAILAQRFWILFLTASAGLSAYRQLQQHHDEKHLPAVRSWIQRATEFQPGDSGLAALIEEGEALQSEMRTSNMQGLLDLLIARIALIGQQNDIARKHLENTTATVKMYPDLYGTLAAQLHHIGEYEASAKMSECLFAEIENPQDAFNVACSRARLGEVDDAIFWLQEATDNGWTEVASLDADPDLASLRALEAWTELRSALKERMERYRYEQNNV